MTYTQNPTWVNGGAPGIAAGALNNIETEYQEASLSFNPDAFTAGFVLSGLTTAKDGVALSQLDLTGGTAYLLQSADNTLRQRVVSTQNFTASTPNTTYYLDLNPDGTLSWATLHSGVTNHLTICSVTTDASSHLSVLTDLRTTGATLLPNMVGTLSTPSLAVNAATSIGPLLSANFNAAPASDQNVVRAAVTGDSSARSALYIRSADGYGGIRAGAGTSSTATLYAQSGGWKTDQNLTIVGSLSSDAGALTSNGSGAVTATAFHGPADSANQVNTTNAGSTSTPQIKAATNTGISTNEQTANSKTLAVIIPTEGNSTLRGLGFGYTDAAGTFHLSIQSDDGAALRHAPSGSIYWPGSHFSGTGSGTFSHGLALTPGWVGITENQANSTMTVGVDSIGGTTVHVNTGTASAWIGMAMA